MEYISFKSGEFAFRATSRMRPLLMGLSSSVFPYSTISLLPHFTTSILHYFTTSLFPYFTLSSDYEIVCPGKHRCANGICMDNVSVCNGVIECLDGSDEMECPQNGLFLFSLSHVTFTCLYHAT